MLPLNILRVFPRRVVIVAGISFASVFLVGIFLYQANAQSLIQRVGSGPTQSSTHKVYLAASAAAEAATASVEETPMLEVHVANNGLVLLRGARILSASGSTFRVGMTWGSTSFTWRIETNYHTQFLTPHGEKETFTDIEVGDIVTVTGTLTEGGAEPTIDANFVRE